MKLEERVEILERWQRKQDVINEYLAVKKMFPSGEWFSTDNAVLFGGMDVVARREAICSIRGFGEADVIDKMEVWQFTYRDKLYRFGVPHAVEVSLDAAMDKIRDAVRSVERPEVPTRRDYRRLRTREEMNREILEAISDIKRNHDTLNSGLIMRK